MTLSERALLRVLFWHWRGRERAREEGKKDGMWKYVFLRRECIESMCFRHLPLRRFRERPRSPLALAHSRVATLPSTVFVARGSGSELAAHSLERPSVRSAADQRRHRRARSSGAYMVWWWLAGLSALALEGSEALAQSAAPTHLHTYLLTCWPLALSRLPRPSRWEARM